MAIFRRGPPITGASNAGGVGTNRDYRQIAGYRSMTAAVRTTAAIVHRAAYRRLPRISESLFITTMDDHDEEKRREENLFVRSDKSEAEVIREDCA